MTSVTLDLMKAPLLILTSVAISSFTLHIIAAESTAPEAFASAREFIEKAVHEGRAPSVAVSVIKEDKLIWAEGFGYADIDRQRRATADSIYLLASVSKPITATGLMVLVDRGQVDLDRPANDYLPGPRLRTSRGSPNDMTIRRLANHTSGMQVHYNFYYDGVPPLSHDEVIRRYGIAHTVPGTAVEYCNLAFGVLDYITEVVSKTPWSRFMEQNVYDPIGMSSTSDHVRPGRETNATQQYQLDMTGKFIAVPSYKFDHNGASAIWSSARDLSRFLRLHLDGGKIEGKRLLQEATVNSMRKVTGAPDPANSDEGFGIAWHMGSHLGHRSFEHTGGMPGVSTLVRGFPTEKAGMVILINASGGNLIGQIAQRLTKALFPDATESSNEPRKSSPKQKEVQFTGLWKGRLTHFDGDIPVVLEVISESAAKVTLGKAPTVSLKDVSVRNGTLTGQTRGILPTQTGYHGPVTLDFRLNDHEGHLAGIAVAKADGYFALSHGVDLMKETESGTSQGGASR